MGAATRAAPIGRHGLTQDANLWVPETRTAWLSDSVALIPPGPR